MAGHGRQAEIASLQKDAQRLIESKDFLARIATPTGSQKSTGS
jgi:hypothetical protein